MPSDRIVVSNLERDKIEFATVYNTKDGKPSKDAEAFTLLLGSKDDDTDEARSLGVRQPRQEVPEWAVAHLRKSAFFVQLEKTQHIAVNRAA